jgi:DNA repair protein REV1
LQVTPRVQAVSCDEAYLDLTGVLTPTEVVRRLRADIAASTGCTVSAGLAANMLLAKLATSRAKPNGMYVMPDDPAVVTGFLNELDVDALPRVGWHTAAKLGEQAVTTVAQLRAVPRGSLEAWFGRKTGEALWKAARGVDERPLQYRQERKSIGAEVGDREPHL